MEMGADTTLISSNICVKLGRYILDGAAQTLEAYDGHKLYFKGTTFCILPWNGRIKAIPGSSASNQTRNSESLDATSYQPRTRYVGFPEGNKAQVKLKLEVQPHSRKACKIPLPIQ